MATGAAGHGFDAGPADFDVGAGRLHPGSGGDADLHDGHLELHRAASLHALGRGEEARAEAGRALAACERYPHPAHPRTVAVRTLLSRITQP